MNLLDLFSGIGGFHLGLQKAGHKIKWSGFCEIDKYASAVYRRRFPDAKELGDIKHVRGRQLPKIDIITFGSPCQDFSIAGKRKGMSGARSSLITQAIRLIDECRPSFFIWENVKGTFSSNNREDFAAILQAFTNIGSYRLEWQLLNTRWVLPQNRERIFLVGHTRKGSGREIFPIGETSKHIDFRNTEVASTLQHPGHSGGNYRGMTMINTGLKQVGTVGKDSVQVADYRNDEGLRIRKDGFSPTLAKRKHSQTDISTMPPLVLGAKTGLYKIDYFKKSKTQTKRIYKDSGLAPTLPSRGEKTGQNSPMIHLTVHNTQTRNPNRPSLTRVCDCGSGKLYKKCCGVDGGSGHISKDDGTTYCLDTGNTQAVEIVEQRTDEGLRQFNDNICGALRATRDCGDKRVICLDESATNRKGKAWFDEYTPTINTEGRLYVGKEKLKTTKDVRYAKQKGTIRRLTPKECERLQGFPDDWTSEGIIDGEVVKISDTQRYKQCGNAVTVDIVALVGERLL